MVGLALGALVVTAPLHLFRMGEPSWRLAIAPAVWALVVPWLFSRTLSRDRDGAFRLLRVGAAGFLLLVAYALPPILAHRESGRDLFLPARGREVLAWGAWRTAWMAGYFYNDGNVREAASAAEVEAAAQEPALVLCGPAERRTLESMSALNVTALAQGPRENALLLVKGR